MDMPVLLLLSVTAIVVSQSSSPQAAVDELLATDRAFSAAGSSKNVVGALSAMFSDDVVMIAPGVGLARGKAKAIDALGTSPDNVEGRIEWTPIRGGIAASGRDGFTFGYMTLKKADNTSVPLKYVAYWVKQRNGWRVAVYKRGRAGEGQASRTLMPAALPDRLVALSTDGGLLLQFRESLDRAERAFSDEAQKIGLGAAFAKHGSADAVNMGPPTGASFVVGAEAIGRAIGEGTPTDSSPVTWAPDGVIVASSGDLGVTFGMIRSNTPPPAGQPGAFPFLTVWRRASPKDPWRYVAE
jgi:ketosteroid isomerase-like protein